MDNTTRIERRLKLHDLRVLMSVVEAGSMSKAAEHLATSQPAVSRAIADLEYSLGVRLLDRDAHGIVPTAYGRALIRRSVVVFDELRLGVKDVEFLSDPTAGEVRIAAPTALSTGFVAAVVDRLTRRHSRIVCHVRVDEPAEVLHRLEEREVDLAITFVMAPPAERGMEAQILFDTGRLVVVAATKNPWSRRRNVRLADLMNEPWTLAPPQSEFSLAGAFRAAGLDPPNPVMAASSILTRLALVAKGRFLTITPAHVFMLARSSMAIKALLVDVPTISRPLGIITLKNRTLTPVAQLFIDCARDVAKSLTIETSPSKKGR